MTDAAPKKSKGRRRRVLLGILCVYALLVGASHIVVQLRSEPASPRTSIDAPAMRKSGPVAGRTSRIAYYDIAPDEAVEPIDTPVILLHGSPGSGDNFLPGGWAGPYSVSTLLSEAGYRSIAIDLPGFGQSDRRPPDYSILAHARSVLATMDALGIERAHVFGFSMGGGVALHMANLDPERVATITMLSSIGAQEAEGSGDYYFEHAKYAVGYALLVAGLEATPHFGFFGEHWQRRAFMRNFWDTDQRPLHRIMHETRTPTLIVHGRHDFLVPAWGAELHHQLIPTSSLVMLDVSHFIPFIPRQVELLGEFVLPFLARHEAPGVPALRTAADFAPVEQEGEAIGDVAFFEFSHLTEWWVLIILIVLGTLISEDATVITVGILIARGEIDFAVGLIGCFVGIVLGDGGLWAIGRFGGRRALRLPFLRSMVPEKSLARWGRWFNSHAIKAVFVARAVPGLRLPTYLAAGLLSDYSAKFILWAALAALIWTPLLLILAGTLGFSFLTAMEGVVSGPLAIVVAVVAILLGIRLIEYMSTSQGRRRLQRDLQILVKPEFWPWWLLYIPATPYLAWLSLRYGGPTVFTCVNPGIPNGGGVVGESKHQILSSFTCDQKWVLPAKLITAGRTPEERAAETIKAIAEDESLGGFPVILKPDVAQRGHGVKVAHNDDEIHRYFENTTRDAIVQRFHDGPHEVGVLWSRRAHKNGSLPERGEIFSITRKEFPRIVGDGERTLEQLIWAHPRYRIQAKVFLTRHADKSDHVLASGEQFTLGVAGNHCQGAVFLDGADLITPELEERIDEISRSFKGVQDEDGNNGAIDFGRYDIRYESDEALKRGEDFAIVELNGVLSESTNMYDPRRPVWWMYSVLFAQWRRLFKLGAQRRRLGARALTIRRLFQIIAEHRSGRTGSSVSD